MHFVGKIVEMETEFCSVALDIIGKAVFNYEFGSVTNESPVIKAVYSTLKEVDNVSVIFVLALYVIFLFFFFFFLLCNIMLLALTIFMLLNLYM